MLKAEQEYNEVAECVSNKENKCCEKECTIHLFSNCPWVTYFVPFYAPSGTGFTDGIKTSRSKNPVDAIQEILDHFRWEIRLYFRSKLVEKNKAQSKRSIMNLCFGLRIGDYDYLSEEMEKIIHSNHFTVENKVLEPVVSLSSDSSFN